MIRGVLFDLGGTLHVNDSPPGRDIWFSRRVIERLGDYGIHLEISPEALAAQLAVNAEEYKRHSEQDLKELGGAEIWSRWFLREQGLSPSQLAPMAEELSFLYDYERVRVMRRPHLAQTMERLQSMGLRMGVISNIISRSVVPHFLAEYGIDGYMDCVITSCGTGIRKPDPGIFRVAEEKMGMAPEELAYVGDTISRDVRGTRAAGWKCMIQIRNPAIAHRDKGLENSPWKPDYLIDDLAEIPGILARENGQIDR